MGGGGDNKQYNLNLRKAFADTPDSRFESYVDSRGDLANAWRMIDTYQKGGDMSGFAMHGNMTPAQQAQYWIKKAEGGRFNKADFGRFHAAEDKSLLEGNYPGGTKVKKGTDAYDKYFPEGTTRFDQFSSEGAEGGGLLDVGGESGGGYGPKPNVYFPMLTSRYERPQAYDLPDYMAATRNLGAYMPANPFMGDGGLLYQPGTEQYADAYPINTGILEYQPPRFGVGPVQYHSPLFGHIEVSHPEEPSNGNGSNNDFENRGGKAVNSGPLSGLGYWSGNEFNDVHGNTWDGTDFSTEAELASMVSFGHPNAEIAFANWGGWNPETTTIADFFSPSVTSGVLGISGGQETSSGQVGGGQVSGNPADAGYSGNY